MIVDNI